MKGLSKLSLTPARGEFAQKVHHPSPAMSRMTAAERLTLALGDVETAGRSWPCRGRNEWISESHKDRAEAAEQCDGCTVLDLCADMAAETRTTFGVYAGRDLTPTLKRKQAI